MYEGCVEIYDIIVLSPLILETALLFHEDMLMKASSIVMLIGNNLASSRIMGLTFFVDAFLLPQNINK